MFVLRGLLAEVLEELNISLENFIAPRIMARGDSIFALLIAVILSQNTNDRNAWRAYSNLVDRLGEPTPEKLANMEVNALAELIRPAGMHIVRANKIVELSRKISLASLGRIKDVDVKEAREYLTSLPGVGKKTADVVLLYLGRPVFPVDTHIMRIAMRLGLADKRDYDLVSRKLMDMFDPSQYLVVHLKLIEFGRRICRSRNPKCRECKLRAACRYAKSRG